MPHLWTMWSTLHGSCHTDGSGGWVESFKRYPRALLEPAFVAVGPFLIVDAQLASGSGRCDPSAPGGARDCSNAARALVFSWCFCLFLRI